MNFPPDERRLAALYRAHFAFLEREYGRILEEEGLDSLVIHSGVPVKKTVFDDQFWPLRPVPQFLHWLPLAEPDCALVLRQERRPRLLRLEASNFWEASPAPESQHWADYFEIATMNTREAQRRELPAPSERVAFVGEDLARAAEWGFSLARPPSLDRRLERVRVHKTEYEIFCLSEANRRAARGHERVRQAFFEGDLSELELHLLYLTATRQDDPETPYKNIVALGPHAATLHHVGYGKRPSARSADSLLLDAGATFCGYASDVTRTYVKGEGEARGTFAALIERTEQMQRRLCQEVAIGLPYEQLHDRSHEEVGQILVDLGLVKIGVDEAVASGITRAFFPHGLGHSLGLVCHDVGCAEVRPRPENPFLRNTSIIAAEQVFTIEPGIYFIDMLLRPLRDGAGAARIDWKRVDALAPLGGVRIEDDLLVTPSGPAHNLTRAHLPT
jgi:Xaa-Pro dipeptidase